MTIHINIFVLLGICISTVFALYFLVGRHACAIYCLLAILSMCMWTYKYIKEYKHIQSTRNASNHLEKHDMSVNISYMDN